MKYQVTRVDNHNKTIDDLGKMTLEEIYEFGKQYIGNDKREWGTIFRNEKDLKDTIEYIEKEGHEYWYEFEDTNIMIEKVE
jgi:hypothetical protein